MCVQIISTLKVSKFVSTPPILRISLPGSTASTSSTEFSLYNASILQEMEDKVFRYVIQSSALTQRELDCIDKVNRKFSRSEPLLKKLSSEKCVASVSKTSIRRNNVSFGNATMDTASQLSTSELWSSEIWENKGKRSSVCSNSSTDSEFILPLSRWKNSSSRRNSERISFKWSSEQRRNSGRSLCSSSSSLGLMPESILSEMRTNISSKQNQSFEESKFEIAVNESITSLEKAK